MTPVKSFVHFVLQNLQIRLILTFENPNPISQIKSDFVGMVLGCSHCPPNDKQVRDYRFLGASGFSFYSDSV